MKILNIMLSRKLGGIQQAFLDYNSALQMQDIEVINVTSIFAKVKLPTSLHHSKGLKLANLGPWDALSKLYLKLLIKIIKPGAIIAHGNRSISFALGNKIPLIGIAHNYSISWLRKCDYIIALTEHMKAHLMGLNINESKIIIIPNMIAIHKNENYKKRNNPIKIGVIARLVPKKGIDIFLHSLAKLKDQGYKFTAIIGGDGEHKDQLVNLSTNLGLAEYVSFIGWVVDKNKFFNDIDIFCIPSLHEPFGIVALEAMESCVPIVASRSEGLVEIIRDKQDGLLCDIGSCDDLASKIAYLIDNEDTAHNISVSAYSRLKEQYDMKILSVALSNFVKKIL
jgi:glycosyltransferase involved in cell wall biosynthesis